MTKRETLEQATEHARTLVTDMERALKHASALEADVLLDAIGDTRDLARRLEFMLADDEENTR